SAVIAVFVDAVVSVGSDVGVAVSDAAVDDVAASAAAALASGALALPVVGVLVSALVTGMAAAIGLIVAVGARVRPESSDWPAAPDLLDFWSSLEALVEDLPLSVDVEP